MLNIKEIKFGSEEYKESIILRDKILRKPLGMVYTKEFLEAEKNEFHIAAFNNTDIVGILLLRKLNDKLLKMRQVAVDSYLQGKGIGKKLVTFSEQFAKERGGEKIELNARDTAVKFYISLNYKKVGAMFKEIGINHYKMEKNI